MTGTPAKVYVIHDIYGELDLGPGGCAKVEILGQRITLDEASAVSE